MIRFFRAFQSSLVFIIKAVMFILLFATFFTLFSIFFESYLPRLLPETRHLPRLFSIVTINRFPNLIGFSRVTVIAVSTYIVIGLGCFRIYGGFGIGFKKSKDIIYSMFLAVLLTDAVTFVQMLVMILGQELFSSVILYLIGVLLLTIFIQYILITFFAYFGNWFYFKMNDPVPTTVIYASNENLDSYLAKIGKYKKQWNVLDVIHYTNGELKKYIRKNQAVFIFEVPGTDASRIVEYCYKHSKDIYLSPEVSDIVLNHAQDMQIDDTTVLAATIRGLKFEQAIIKRTCDIVLSLIGLIVFSPVMLIEAIAIKAYDRGPVFYRQERFTKDGKIFNVLKFRTMIVNAERSDMAIRSTQNDTRITPVGKVLRALRIDEIPQFINILIGDMSFVGPRPERTILAEEYEKELPEYRYRLKVKAGLTGLAQILGKYNTTPKDKLTLDLVYIQRYSIWLDIKLIFQTFIVLFKKDSTEGFDEDNDDVKFVKHGKDPGVKKNEETPYTKKVRKNS